jgi:hypothetical protein
MMNSEPVLYEGGGLRVTPSRVSTARQTIMLRDIDHIACRRPLLRVMAPVAIGVGLVALRPSRLPRRRSACCA